MALLGQFDLVIINNLAAQSLPGPSLANSDVLSKINFDDALFSGVCEEFSDYLINEGVIKTKGEKKSR